MAGTDLPLMPVPAQSQANVLNSVAPLYEEIEKRANEKPELMARIDDSAAKILKFKMERGIYDPEAGENQPCFAKPLEERIADAEAALRSDENIAIEKNISDKAITLAKNDVIDGKAVLPFEISAGDEIFVLGPLSAQNNLILERVRKIIDDAGLTGEVAVSGSIYGTGAASFTDAHKAAIDSATHVLIGSTVVDANSRKPGTTAGNGGYATNSNNIWKYIESNGFGGKSAGISYSLPYELSYLEYCSAMVNTSCRSSLSTVQIYGSAVDAIFGVFNPTGKFQVDVPHPETPDAFIRKVGDGLSYEQEESIPVESIHIYSGLLLTRRGKTIKLNPEITPSNANETLVWESSSPEVAEISQDGTLTAKKSGLVIIRLTTADRRVYSIVVVGISN
jgi:uncharacterized protein YjdB